MQAGEREHRDRGPRDACVFDHLPPVRPLPPLRRRLRGSVSRPTFRRFGGPAATESGGRCAPNGFGSTSSFSLRGAQFRARRDAAVGMIRFVLFATSVLEFPLSSRPSFRFYSQLPLASPLAVVIDRNERQEGRTTGGRALVTRRTSADRSPVLWPSPYIAPRSGHRRRFTHFPPRYFRFFVFTSLPPATHCTAPPPGKRAPFDLRRRRSSGNAWPFGRRSSSRRLIGDEFARP